MEVHGWHLLLNKHIKLASERSVNMWLAERKNALKGSVRTRICETVMQNPNTNGCSYCRGAVALNINRFAIWLMDQNNCRLIVKLSGGEWLDFECLPLRLWFSFFHSCLQYIAWILPHCECSTSLHFHYSIHGTDEEIKANFQHLHLSAPLLSADTHKSPQPVCWQALLTQTH